MTETPHTLPRLVVIGNGMAAIRALEELLTAAPGAYDITVIGKEPHGSYNRIMLSPVLAGESSQQEIMIHDPDWYAEQGMRLLAGEDHAVVEIHRGHREVETRNGTRIPYDKLLIATGSDPVRIPLPGHEADGVVCFRNIADVDAMLARCRPGRPAVVIGGGLLGLEAASGLAKRGMEVSVIDLAPYLLCNQLDGEAAGLLQQELESRGIRFYLGAKSKAVLTRSVDRQPDEVSGLELDDSTRLPADMVVMAAGIRPNIQLAQDAGLSCNRGILVNDCLQTYDPSIYAIGECVEHRSLTFGLVEPLFEQAKVVANHLACHGVASYTYLKPATRLKISGINLYSMGEYQPNDAPSTDDKADDEAAYEVIYLRDPGAAVYKKLVIRDNRLVGAVLYGDTQDGPWYHQLMREQQDISSFRSALVFGHKPAAIDPTASSKAALSKSAGAAA